MTPDDFERWQREYQEDDEEAQRREIILRQKLAHMLDPEAALRMYYEWQDRQSIRTGRWSSRHLPKVTRRFSKSKLLDTDAEPDPQLDSWFLKSCGIDPTL